MVGGEEGNKKIGKPLTSFVEAIVMTLSVSFIIGLAVKKFDIQTVSRTIGTLLRVSGTDALVHWICARLLVLPVAAQAHCIPAFCAVLSSSSPPPLIQVFYFLHSSAFCLYSKC